jgi:hypothetical protein
VVVALCRIFYYCLFSLYPMFGVMFLSIAYLLVFWSSLFRRRRLQQPSRSWRTRLWAAREKRQVSLTILKLCSILPLVCIITACINMTASCCPSVLYLDTLGCGFCVSVVFYLALLSWVTVQVLHLLRCWVGLWFTIWFVVFHPSWCELTCSGLSKIWNGGGG